MASMRSIWKGDLSFGLVNVPVKVYSATESHDRKSYQVDSSDGTRIRYRRVREGTDTEVEFSDIASAYESSAGDTVILTKDDLASLPVHKSPEISILEFVPTDQVDPIYFDKPYYLEPSSKSPKAYVLLARALQETDRLAIASFTLRNRTRMAALRVVEPGVMTLQTLLWPDEVRTPDFGFLGADVEIRDQELAMASSLIDSMAQDYDPTEFSDTYQEELTKLIDAKSDGAEAFPETEKDSADDDSEVADLLAALRASVKDHGASAQGASAQGSHAQGSHPVAASPAPASPAHTEDAAAAQPPAKKAAAQKVPAKKAAAQKVPAKKTVAKKTPTKKAAAKKTTRQAS